MKFRSLIAGAFLCSMFVSGTAIAANLNVPSDYPNIQSAYNASQQDDVIVLADGIYSGDGNHDIVIQGYVSKKITIKSLNGPANCSIDLADNGRFAKILNTANTTIEGLTIKNGNAGTEGGGAIYINNPLSYTYPVTIKNCVFDNNQSKDGGAIFATASTFSVLGSKFVNNHTKNPQNIGNSTGGAISTDGDQIFSVKDSIFENNTAPTFGGAIFIRMCEPIEQAVVDTISNSTFIGNASSEGGAIFAFGRSGRLSVKIDRSTMKNNSASSRGEAIRTYESGTSLSSSLITGGGSASPMFFGSVDFTNCTVIGNNTGFLGLVKNSVVMGSTGTSVLGSKYSNCILSYAVNASDATSCYFTDPQFIDATAGNYRLKTTSPGINTGNNSAPNMTNLDLDGKKRIQYGTVDIGAYELGVDGDINNDMIIDCADLQIFNRLFTEQFGMTSQSPQFDARLDQNADEVINIQDLNQYLNYFPNN